METFEIVEQKVRYGGNALSLYAWYINLLCDNFSLLAAMAVFAYLILCIYNISKQKIMNTLVSVR
jgi:hypothetical protein